MLLRRVRIWMIVALGATILSACAGPRGIAPSGTAATPATAMTTTTAASTDVAASVYGGTVVVGVADGGSPRGLNPFLEGPDSGVLDLIAPAVFAQGYDTDPVTGIRVPDALVATPSMEAGTIVDNSDGTVTVTVSVVDGARWADGAPMTAQDLEYTIRVATDPNLPIRPEIRAVYEGVVPGSARAVGQTLTYRMRTGFDPGALFEFIVPRHAVEASDFRTDWDDELWVSGGPFVLADWEPGSFIELIRNEEYWKVTAVEGARLPFLDRVVIRFFEPGDDLDPRLVQGFERGDLDVVVFERAETRAAAFADAQEAGAVVESVASGEWDHLNFQFGPANRNSLSLNERLDFRRAVAAAIDRDALAATRGTVRVDSILEHHLPGASEQPFAAHTADPERVTALLYEIELATGRDMFAGDGPAVMITVASAIPTTVALAGQIVVMLREAGIGAQLQLESSDIFFGTTLDNGSWDVSTWRINSSLGLGAALEFIRIYDPAGLPFVGANYFRWGTVDSTVSNAATVRYGEIVAALDRTVDPAELTDLVIEAEQILADELVLLPLIVSHLDGVGHWPAAVLGVASNPGQGILWNVDTWRVPSG